MLAVARFGRPAVVTAVRQVLDAARAALRAGNAEPSQPERIASAALANSRRTHDPIFGRCST